jgi:hypothetical protein
MARIAGRSMGGGAAWLRLRLKRTLTYSQPASNWEAPSIHQAVVGNPYLAIECSGSGSNEHWHAVASAWLGKRVGTPASTSLNNGTDTPLSGHPDRVAS